MNPLFSKLISLILVVLILFSIFRYIYLDYSTYQKDNPYLVEYDKSISSLTNISNNKINVSEDQRGGLEFTYAFWLNLNDTDDKIIFRKGNKNQDSNKLELSVHSDFSGNSDIPNDPLSIPSNTEKLIYLKLRVPIYKADNSYKCLNNMNKVNCQVPCYWEDDKCQMTKCSNLSTDQPVTTRPALGGCEDYDFCRKNPDSSTNQCVDRQYHDLIIQNIPFKKWFHLSLIFINKYVDVYINGNLYNRFELVNIVKQNNNDLEFGNSSSRIMRFQYFNYALPSYKIQSLVSNTDITSAPEENEYIDDNYFNKQYWVKDILSENN